MAPRKNGTNRGTVQGFVEITKADEARIKNRIARGAPTACWPWKGAKTSKGYGRVKIGGRLVLPHRVIYATMVGDVPADSSYHGAVVMHTCDNPACCNPAHLCLGTQRENILDMSRKGRGGSPTSSPVQR